MSRKNNINTDHYKNGGRGRQGDGVIHGALRRSITRANVQAPDRGDHPYPGPSLRRSGLLGRLEKVSRAQTLKRLRKIRGLSARQLMERRMRERTAERVPLTTGKDE